MRSEIYSLEDRIPFITLHNNHWYNLGIGHAERGAYTFVKCLDDMKLRGKVKREPAIYAIVFTDDRTVTFAPAYKNKWNNKECQIMYKCISEFLTIMSPWGFTWEQGISEDSEREVSYSVSTLQTNWEWGSD